MSFGAPIVHAIAAGDANTATPSAIDTTGATCLVAIVSTRDLGAPAVANLSDSKSNVWQTAGSGGGATGYRVRAFICCLTPATRNLIFTTQPADGDTVTLNGKVYTFQTTLTNVDGHVLIGASMATARANFVAAVTLAAGAGTTYAASTTAHATMTAYDNGTNAVISALTAGVAGNSLTTTASSTHISFGGGTLTGGSDAPTVGSGHTATYSLSVCYPSVAFMAFSGNFTAFTAAIQSALDKASTGTATSVTSLATGSVTPAVDGELIIAATGHATGTSAIGVDSGMTMIDQVSYPGGSAGAGLGVAYLVQGAAAAINATLSWTTASNAGTTIVTLRPSVAAGTPRVTSRGIVLAATDVVPSVTAPDCIVVG